MAETLALPPQPLAPVVSVEGLAKAYGAARPVLHGVSFTAAPGERVALIGANGSGKSTFLRCLIGLSASDAGVACVLGERFERRPSTAQRARLRRRTGFVFQNHCLVKRLTALSNVVHGMLGAPGGWRAFTHVSAPGPWREAAMAALDSVGLAGKALERADALSGGQAQRVAIARALVRGPDLLIADEPAASLDPAAGRDVMALFSRIAAERGVTLIFTTHDMDHALAFADRVVALKAGRVVIDAPAAALAPRDLARVFDG